MIDRRDVLVGSATALAASLMTPAMPAFAQATTVPGSKRGFLDRPGCRIYYEVTGSGPPIVFAQWAWQQSPHLVAAGPPFLRSLHLRDIRSSWLSTGERDRRP